VTIHQNSSYLEDAVKFDEHSDTSKHENMLLSRVIRELPHLNASARYEWFYNNIVVFRDVFNPTTTLSGVLRWELLVQLDLVTEVSLMWS